MTLYEEIKKIKHRQEIDATFSLFNLRDEALILLQQPAYRKNWLAMRMEEGQKLEAMTQQLIDDGRYVLKFKENEREEYNQRVQELEEMASHARHLRYHPFFSWHTPEGGALLAGTAAILLNGSLVASNPRNVSEFFAGAMTLATIGAYSIFGACIGSSPYGRHGYQRPRMWKEIQYIDNILQKR